ncbi:MAG: hypothetical protein WAL02_18510, partial [Rhodoplanes sp.]
VTPLRGLKASAGRSRGQADDRFSRARSPGLWMMVLADISKFTGPAIGRLRAIGVKDYAKTKPYVVI